MKDNFYYFFNSLVISLLVFVFATIGCKEEGDDNLIQNSGSNEIYDVDKNGIPKFVNVNYIELDKISRISKFRSSVGHDYSDDFESCRNMKHYFEPKSDVDWSLVRIFSPVNGIVIKVFQEWAGTQLQIKTKKYPPFHFIIFHVNLINPVKVGDEIMEGQLLGTHISSQTMSDIAVGVTTPKGWKLVSYFEVITDSVFHDYKMRGLSSRSDVIISKEVRDADSLFCHGGAFSNSGTVDNWVVLN